MMNKKSEVKKKKLLNICNSCLCDSEIKCEYCHMQKIFYYDFLKWLYSLELGVPRKKEPIDLLSISAFCILILLAKHRKDVSSIFYTYIIPESLNCFIQDIGDAIDVLVDAPISILIILIMLNLKYFLVPTVVFLVFKEFISRMDRGNPELLQDYKNLRKVLGIPIRWLSDRYPVLKKPLTNVYFAVFNIKEALLDAMSNPECNLSIKNIWLKLPFWLRLIICIKVVIIALQPF